MARDAMLSEYLDIPIHISHVSSALSVDVLRWARARGVKITAETCPHYLMLDESALRGYNANAKVSPPAAPPRRPGGPAPEAVRDGILGVLSTDHAPHALHEKERTLDEAPKGFTGLGPLPCR